MNCNIVINQQLSLPTSEGSAPQTKTKGQNVLPAGAKKTKGKAFKRQSRNADDLKRIYRLFSARPG